MKFLIISHQVVTFFCCVLCFVSISICQDNVDSQKRNDLVFSYSTQLNIRGILTTPSPHVNCNSYSLSGTQSTELTYKLCSFQACGGTSVTVSGCDQCIGDQLIRLFNSSSQIEMSMDDDGCGDTGSCSLISFVVPGPTNICDNSYTVREGCWSDDSCSGTVTLFGVSALSTFVPTTIPTRKPSIQPSRTPSIISTLAPSLVPSGTPILGPISSSSSSSSSDAPSNQPGVVIASRVPTQLSTKPTVAATSIKPTTGSPVVLVVSKSPSGQPTTKTPSLRPVSTPPSVRPSLHSSVAPSVSLAPTFSFEPSTEPTEQPVTDQTELPRLEPSPEPSQSPVEEPSFRPSFKPSRIPSIRPTVRPTTSCPTTISPTVRPTTRVPTLVPTVRPSTRIPTTSRPSFSPTFETIWVASPTSPLTHWISIAASGDGMHLMATTERLGIYYSSDSGASWAVSDAPSECDWMSISCSSDGSIVVAVCNGVGAYLSQDAGKIWSGFSVSTNNRRNLLEISLKSDVFVVYLTVGESGLYMFAVMSDGTIVRTKNSGSSSWSVVLLNHPSTKVFCTTPAKYVLALGRDGCVFWSSSYGDSWTVLSVSCVGFSTAAMSDDGQYITLIAQDSTLNYYSSNFGATFVSFHTGAIYPFTTIVVSSSGQYLAATSSGADCIYLSTTYGLTWSCSPSSPVVVWTSLSMDSRGGSLVAGGANSRLYRMQTVGEDDDINSGGGGSKANFWDPILAFNWNSYPGYAIIVAALLCLLAVIQQCIKWRKARLAAQANTTHTQQRVNRTLDLQYIASSSRTSSVQMMDESPAVVVIHHHAPLAHAMYDRDSTLQRISSRSSSHVGTKFGPLGMVDTFSGAPSAPPSRLQSPAVWEMDNGDAGFYEIDLNSFMSGGGGRGRNGRDYDDVSVAQV